MNAKIPLYIADLADNADKMLALSIVERPASGYLCKVIREDETSVDVFAPILPANTPIYRNNEAYGEHYVMFLPDVISDIMADASKRNVVFDVEHSGTPIDGICLMSSFQIDYGRNTLYNAYRGLPDGTWAGLLRINKATMKRNMVKRNMCGRSWPFDIFGISISGIFSYHPLSLSEAVEFLKN